MDLSGSVDMAYNYTIKFVQRVIHGLELRFDRVRVAAVTYSDTAARQFLLGEYTGKQDVLNALAFDKAGGRTNTQDALRLVNTDVFQVGLSIILVCLLLDRPLPRKYYENKYNDF